MVMEQPPILPDDHADAARRLTGAEYVAALSSLGFDPPTMAEWIGVSRRAAYGWVHTGPSPAASVAIRYALKYGTEIA